MSILKDFYDGNICPVEEIVPLDEKYRPLSKAIGKEREYFEEQLSEEDKERFREWNQQVNDYEQMNEYANFSYGFKLGAMLVFEIFMEKESK